MEEDGVMAASSERETKIALFFGLCLGAFGVGIPNGVPLVRIGIFILGVLLVVGLLPIGLSLIERVGRQIWAIVRVRVARRGEQE